MVRRDAIGSADEGIEFIEGLIRTQPRPQAVRERVALGPMRRLLGYLGHPEDRLTCFHLAGSKGKGSTALSTEHLLRKAGRSTGLYTSPHLSRWTERFRIDGTEVAPEDFAVACELVRQASCTIEDDASIGVDERPGFFEALTAVALVLFARARVEFAILETGLGGRLDATSAVRPVLTCITTIELEHTDKLGNSFSAIAKEKAGILKAGVPVLLGSMPAEAAHAIRERAEVLGAPVFQLGHEIALERCSPLPSTEAPLQKGSTGLIPSTTVTLRYAGGTAMASPPVSSNRWPPLATSFVLDVHLAALSDNFSLATLAALNLEPSVSEVLPSGFEGFSLPGRLEYIGTGPRYLVDGAHTPRSIALLTETVTHSAAPDIHLLLSVSGDRQAGELLHPLLEIAHRVTLTRADPRRSKAASLLAVELFEGRDPKHRYPRLERVSVHEDPEIAFRQAKADLSPQSLLVVTGSMYLAGRIRAYLVDDPPESANRVC